MRKLLRLLLVAGSLLLLLHDARRSAVAQYCYTAPAVEQTPAGCCGPDEPINAITPCNTCTSPGGTEPSRSCNNGTGTLDAAAYDPSAGCQTGSGNMALFTANNWSCQQLDTTNPCDTGYSCPACYTYTFWGEDSDSSCTTLSQCSGEGSCSVPGQCGSGYNCVSGCCVVQVGSDADCQYPCANNPSSSMDTGPACQMPGQPDFAECGNGGGTTLTCDGPFAFNGGLVCGCCNTGGGTGGSGGNGCSECEWGTCNGDEDAGEYQLDPTCPSNAPYCDDADMNDCNCCDEAYDPIIIDVQGNGYSLTSAANGVEFDMAGNGKLARMAWTSAGSDNAFLALDRNGNGVIDNGTELFSNFTPQPQPQPQPAAGIGKNGWNALAVYDEPANGGNGDGWTDAHDAIYPKLLLWVDRNHDGKSEPNELFTLAQLGIERISLDYTMGGWTDAYGNIFRYRSSVVHQNPYTGEQDAAYDVMLKVAKK